MRMILVNNSKKIKKRKYKLLLLILIIFLLSIYILYKLTLNVSHYYMDYSVREVNIMIDNALSSAIDNKVLNKIDKDNIYKITKSDSGDIEIIDYNSYLINNFLKEVSGNVLKKLRKEEEKNDNVAFYVPVGVIFNNPMFNNIGPKIPVRMEVSGSIFTNVKVKIKDFGINNCLIEMMVYIKVTEKVILPITTKKVTVENEIPITYKIIKGNIPAYYGNSIDKDSSVFRLPIE